MKFSIFLIFLLVFGIHIKAQKTYVLEEGIKFQLSENWKKSDQKLSATSNYYAYDRNPIVKNDKRYVPRILVITEKNSKNLNLAEFTLEKRIEFSFSTSEVYFPTDKKYPLKFKNAIAYFASYEDASNITHEMLIIHALVNDYAIQFIIDVDAVIYENCKKELLEIFANVVAVK